MDFLPDKTQKKQINEKKMVCKMETNIETRIKNFTEFHELLTKKAPEGYTPWYFPCAKNNKNPDPIAIMKRAPPECPHCKKKWRYEPKTKQGKPCWHCPQCKQTKGSWHMPYAQLNREDAIELIKKGQNIGISARKNDARSVYDRWPSRRYIRKTVSWADLAGNTAVV